MVRETVDRDYIILLHQHSDSGVGEYIVRHYHTFDEARRDWESIGDLSEGWTASWSVFDHGSWQEIDNKQ